MADPSDASDDDSVVLDTLYQPATPHMHKVEYRDGKDRLYLPIQVGIRNEFSPNFLLPEAANPTAAALCELFFCMW